MPELVLRDAQLALQRGLGRVEQRVGAAAGGDQLAHAGFVFVAFYVVEGDLVRGHHPKRFCVDQF